MSAWKSTIGPALLETYPVSFFDREKFNEAHEFLIANGILCIVELKSMVFNFQNPQDRKMLQSLVFDRRAN